MDFKKIMLAVAESQADQFKEKAVAWVQSEEFQDELASKINDKIEFYPSVVSQAIVFPSKLIHRGIAPNKFFNRFSLNMVVEI